MPKIIIEFHNIKTAEIYADIITVKRDVERTYHRERYLEKKERH